MRAKWFLGMAVAAFLIATTGSDLFARVTIGGQTFASALREHLQWAAYQFIGTLMLFAPFAFLALVASRVADRTRTWKAAMIFAFPTLWLICLYFDGYRAAQIAMLSKRWTAASLSVGLLPFWALPVVMADWLVGVVLLRLPKSA